MSTGWQFPGKFSPLGDEAVSKASQGPVRHSAVNQMRLPADVWRVEIPTTTLSFPALILQSVSGNAPHISPCVPVFSHNDSTSVLCCPNPYAPAPRSGHFHMNVYLRDIHPGFASCLSSLFL